VIFPAARPGARSCERELFLTAVQQVALRDGQRSTSRRRPGSGRALKARIRVYGAAPATLAPSSASTRLLRPTSRSIDIDFNFMTIPPLRRVRSMGMGDLALPVIRANSSSEPGAFSAITRNGSRLPADCTLAKRLGRGEPELRLIGREAPLTAPPGHGAGFHLVIAGDAHLQCRHGITRRSRNTGNVHPFISCRPSGGVAARGQIRSAGKRPRLSPR
jgi:hypothetical protein